MTHVIPLRLGLADIAEISRPMTTEAGMDLTCLPDDQCALCQIGCCVQSYRLDVGADEGIVIHHMAGCC